MAISDGVPNFILLSAAAFLGQLPGEYIRSKRDAETYLKNSGLDWTIVRAPTLYESGGLRTPLLSFMSLMGVLPPFRWMLGKAMPISVDAAARGIATAVMDMPKYERRVLYANDLRRMAKQRVRGPLMVRPALVSRHDELDSLDETPFGWTPPRPKLRKKD
jgi:nucleoside-diphosphate-sugar epimerase